MDYAATTRAAERATVTPIHLRLPSQTRNTNNSIMETETKASALQRGLFLFKKHEALKEARFCRLHPLQLEYLYLQAHESLEKCFDKITSSYLQFGGGSSVISASSF